MVGLRALATGLPPSFLLNPRRALADGTACGASGQAQYVIFNTSGQGDPLNASVPGTYDDPKIVHSPDPAMAPTPLTIARPDLHGRGALGHAAAGRPGPHLLLAPDDEHAGAPQRAARAAADGRDGRR